MLQSCGFHLDHLVEAAEAGDLDDASTAVCYLMALLGSTVFCDRSQNRVHIGVLEGLRDVRMTREYSWGTATLLSLTGSSGLLLERGLLPCQVVLLCCSPGYTSTSPACVVGRPRPHVLEARHLLGGGRDR